MKFPLLAALPLLIVGTGAAHAQSLSRAIPPEIADVRAVSLQRVDAPSSRTASRPVMARTSMLQPLVAVRGLRASAALPPDSGAAPAPAIPKPSVARPSLQIAQIDANAATVELAVRQIREEGSDDAPPARVARAGRSDLDGDVRCVAQAVFHEARGESVQGQRAVADVVMNRARSGRWGGSACSVVNAPSQFSNRWSWHAPQMGVAAWDRAISIARDAVSGAVGVSSHLMNFRAASMGARSLRALRIGNHVFW